jgi:hypothetical protein
MRNGPDTALAVRHNLALALFRDGQFAEVEEIFRRLLPIEMEKIGRSMRRPWGVCVICLKCWKGRGRKEEAKDMLGEGWVLVEEMEENDSEKR